MRISILLLTMLTLVAMLVACGEPSTQRQSRNIQRDIGQQAFAAVPPYHPSSYAAREDINWYLQETEQPGQTWYVYAINFSGEPMFYIVSDMKPRNICVSITAPDEVASGGSIRSAIALDGVYYGGARCDAYYVRDSATGGFIELAGSTFSLITSKVPLALETDRLVLEAGNP